MTNKSVTIIGAGPAGSAAALMLARRGWSVTLIEQHRFPRDKVCGECLSALGIDVLDRLGLMPSLREKGAVSLEQAILHSSGGAFTSTPLPHSMLGISRHVLDAMLLEAARSVGVRGRQPARCEGIAACAQPASAENAEELFRAGACRPGRAEGTRQTFGPTGPTRPGSVTVPQSIETEKGVTVRVRELDRNVVETIASSFAILADGKAALPGPPPTNTGDIGIKTHFTGVDGPRDAIELFGCDGCYGGLAAIEGGRWNAAFSVPADRVRAHRGDIEALFAELVRENRSLTHRLARAERILPWLASPLPRFAVRKEWLPRVIPIGNAAAALEPIGGEGMGLALRSAELAAEAIDRSREDWNIARERQLRRAFDNLWRVRRVACRAAAMVASSTDAGNVALDWMRSNESLIAVAMRTMGKSHRS